MPEVSPSQKPELVLEHFTHIEDVVRFVKEHLPKGTGTGEWKNVCEDVLHCELEKIEPLLLEELKKHPQETKEDELIRALLRAASWYTHPQLSSADLLKQADILLANEELTEISHASDALLLAKTTLEKELSGVDVLPAAQALETLIERFTDGTNKEATLLLLRELRDQLYYQLLYPHWFSLVQAWNLRQAQK
ncbi:hypothetical protein KBA73_00235 [Patescibacteria group bacterium]|nr:hypothetical protein [Patescibacteria group bacterium]